MFQGKFICHRNLNNSGNKRGKKKKCRFQCDKVSITMIIMVHDSVFYNYL